MNASYSKWLNHGAHRSASPASWKSDDLDNLEWITTYSIDEIPVNDNWNTFATKKKLEQEELYRAWGVPKEGTKHYMSIRPLLNNNLSCLISEFQNKKFTYNFLKLTPGCQLPWHYDTYATFVKFNNIEETEIGNVCRRATMMHDWDRGQIFQIGSSIYTNWQAGDCFTWKGDVWHGVCNFGPSDIIIAQITFLDDENRYNQFGE
jgi:hypothetical protein